MTHILRHRDGEIQVTDLPDGRRQLRLIPRDPRLHMPADTCETTYPDELISLFLEETKFGWLCWTLSRDENPNELETALRQSLFSYVPREAFRGKRLLDFGCGRGPSTMVLGRTLPETDIVGVELNTGLLRLADATAAHHGLRNVRFLPSPNGTELPPEIGPFDFVVLSAVYEHLLPDERKLVPPLIWNALATDGILFVNQTPHRYFPIETHSTGLPLINYLPDRLTHWTVRRFAGRERSITGSASWEEHLRGGLRGATEREILRNLGSDPRYVPLLLEPCIEGLRDRVDLWYHNLNPERHHIAKRAVKLALRMIYSASGTLLSPNLTLAIKKVVRRE